MKKNRRDCLYEFYSVVDQASESGWLRCLRPRTQIKLIVCSCYICILLFVILSTIAASYLFIIFLVMVTNIDINIGHSNFSTNHTYDSDGVHFKRTRTGLPNFAPRCSTSPIVVHAFLRKKFGHHVLSALIGIWQRNLGKKKILPADFCT